MSYSVTKKILRGELHILELCLSFKKSTCYGENAEFLKVFECFISLNISCKLLKVFNWLRIKNFYLKNLKMMLFR
jgi:hypothetical protein